MRRAGLDTDYTYAVARIRVLENRLFKASDLETMLEGDINGVLRTIAQLGPYSKISEPLDDNDKIEKAFAEELSYTYLLVYKMAHEKGLVEPFFKKSELLNDPSKAPSERLDEFMWDNFRNAWKLNSFLDEYIRMAIDLENIKILFRMRARKGDKQGLERYLLSGGHLRTSDISGLFGKSDDEIFSRMEFTLYDKAFTTIREDFKRDNNIALFERSCDDFLIEYLKTAKYFHFGAEPLIAYILAKENEVKNLRIILIGKLNNFKRDRIRFFLRKSYV